MHEALISVIIPVYKAEKYLASCIESILQQTYPNFEIVLVDDGSPDNCPNICDEYANSDNRISVIHQKNKGVSAARNAGINNANGDYLVFVDSDDELFPNALEILMTDANKFDADMVSAVKCTVKANGDVVNLYEDFKCLTYTGLDSLVLSLDYDRQTNSVCAKLFKKSSFKNIRFEEGRQINEDGFFLFQCYANKPKVVQHNVCIYKYFVRENSNSGSRFSDKYLDMIYFCERKKEIVDANFPQLKDKLLNMEISTHLFFLEVLCRTTDKKYNAYAKQSIKLVKKGFKRYSSINPHERKMAKIVAYGLYPLYKKLIRIKYRKVLGA